MSATPVSLYFELETDQIADLEVVARAALAFTNAVRELAFVVDPTLDIRIELASGTQGSLSLNAVLRNLRGKVDERVTLKALAWVIVLWLANHALDYAFEKSAEGLFGGEVSDAHFTPEQHQELMEIVQMAIKNGVAQRQVQQFYREIERDPAISGVGATTIPGKHPLAIVPRSEFPARAGRLEMQSDVAKRRTTLEHARVILISPVLVDGSRRWKLKLAGKEFGAVIQDVDFRKRVLTGASDIRLKAGIEMLVELETTEEFRNDVWEIVDYSVSHVDQLIDPPAQPDLGLFAPERNEPAADRAEQ